MSDKNQVSNDNKSLTDELKEEEEDVPSDFFDDFSNQDFMAGLDIVDDDEWENDNKTGLKTEKNKKLDHVDDSQRSPPGTTSSRGGNSPLTRRYRSPLSPIRQRKSTDDSDIRRDPEKTKRDIQRDKDKCAKNKEKKLISEKLNVVETGLVPPGMEMEVDLDEVIKGKRKSSSPKGSSRTRDLRERLSRGSLERRRRHKSHSRSPMRKRLHRPSPRRYSPLRSSPRRSPRRSPPRRSPHRLSSNRRGSPVHHRRISPKHRERSYSPRRSRRSRSRSRNRSPRHRKQEEKKSFLQELAEKLNEPSSSRNVPIPVPMPNYVPIVPRPVPAPAPVPPPAQYYNPPAPVMPSFDPYDTQFFIGNQPTVVPMMPNFIGDSSTQSIGLPSSLTNNLSLKSHQPSTNPPNPLLDTVSISSSSNDSLPTRTTKSKATHRAKGTLEQIDTKGDLSKLLEEKKISLSDFLSIAAKPEVQSSDPVQLQEKIKVISRCQEALKFLSNEKQFSGRLCVYTERTVPDSVKWSLLKPPPNLSYTTPKTLNENTFTHILNRLFRFVGLPKRIPLEENELDIVKAGDDMDLDLEPPPPPTISPQKQKQQQQQPQQKQQQQQQQKQKQKQLPKVKQQTKNTSILGSKFLMKMVQTDPVKCEQCQLRNSKKYETIGVQCGESSQSTVSTQVCEEDIMPKKKQSLAALTPAQLLGKSNEGRSTDTQPTNKDKEVRPKRNNFDRNRFNNQYADMYQGGPNRGYSPSRQMRFSPPRLMQLDPYMQPLFPAEVDFYDRPREPPNFRNNPNYPPRYDNSGYRY